MHVKKPSKSPVREPPFMFPHTRPLQREMVRLQSQWFIHSFMTVGVPKKEPSHEMGENTVTVHLAPRGRKTYTKWGAAWSPKGVTDLELTLK
jgi:hypothetical protein